MESILIDKIKQHQHALKQCRRCENMIPPVVIGEPVASTVLLIGQAPGEKEGILGRPFAWTAGKTLFKWFASIGLEEAEFRTRVYMAAVCRCFPGKNPKGGDRVPTELEIRNCADWLDAEIALLKPQLIIPVGKLAITQFIEANRLVDAIGHEFELDEQGECIDIIPLPHPSGASTWHRTEPGISLLQRSLSLIEQHPAWQALLY